MTDVDKLFSEYRQAHRSGDDADPSIYLERLEGVDRSELAALIDAYLARSPGRAWDADLYAGSAAERAVERIASEWVDWELAPEPTGWPELLPALRNRARLKRQELVQRLADALGVSDERDRVAAYYHDMETGSLAPEGVSNRVLDSLAEILGETRERLRAAGSAMSGEVIAEHKISFARKALPSPEFDALDASAEALHDEGPMSDHVDELFTGGPDAGI
jgi:hypothetical protein